MTVDTQSDPGASIGQMPSGGAAVRVRVPGSRRDAVSGDAASRPEPDPFDPSAGAALDPLRSARGILLGLVVCIAAWAALGTTIWLLL
jgi:hypothetical protein